ncbi:integrase, catalytic region, zinc finger, CCHC-type containing protein [Tanacetum coccineum]|uniref:Integrase, catalytic region, zinc finger, CCHC-type containing protein n=1 Tax=Tanacetum coccineum TaxID=301880 RepID=A0ABQ5DLM9_9ASTR
MKPILATDTAVARLQTEDDLTGDDLKPYEADFEALILILISIPNDIYNSLDACENARDNQSGIVNASRAKRAAKTYDPLALVANTFAICDDQDDSLTTEMMLLARSITQHYSIPTNNCLPSSSNTRNQAVVQADRVDIQSRNVGNGGRYARRSSGTQGESAESGNVQKETGNGNCYNCNAKGHYARECPKPRVWDSKYFLEQRLLAKNDEAEIILTNVQNNFLLADASEIEELEDLSANICMMARIQQADKDPEDRPIYDSSFISVLQNPSTSFMNPLFSQSDHDQTYHEQHDIIKPIIYIDQINSDIIFDDPNVEVNDGKVEHDKNAHDRQDNAMDLLARNAYKETEKQLLLPKKVNQRNVELTKELRSIKKRLNGVNSVRRPSTRSSSSKNSVLSNTKIHSEVVEVYAEKNKKTNVTSRMNAVKIKKHVANVHTKNALIASADVIQIVLWIIDSGCSKHMTGNLKLLRNFVEKFMRTVRFRNDHFATITRYEDYVHGNVTICHVYYVEGLGHNLFSVSQFCDGDLEVAFRSKTCYVHNLEGEDLLTGARDSNLYTISISYMAASSPMWLMSKATSTKSWLWHRRLWHLNFGTINHLTNQDLVDGLLKFKYDKDHLCFACEQGKRKKASLYPKFVHNTHFKLELIHMDLYGPMRVESINGKKYILVIVNDYSRYTWMYFLRTKDEASDMIMKFIAQVQFNFKVQIQKYLSEGTTLISNDVANESILEDSANLEANKLITPFCPPKTEEGESSSINQDPLDMHEFNQVHPSTHTWMKAHLLEQVIGNPLKPVMTRSRLNTHAEVFPRPINRNIIGVKWLWNNKSDAENTVIRKKSRLVAKGTVRKKA